MTDKMTAEQALEATIAFLAEHLNEIRLFEDSDRDESMEYHLDRALQALSAPRVQWQPIDTAPTDGTNVLVLLKSGSVMQAEFWDFWMPVYFSATKIEPTHWMPLPPPPAEVKP